MWPPIPGTAPEAPAGPEQAAEPAVRYWPAPLNISCARCRWRADMAGAHLLNKDYTHVPSTTSMSCGAKGFAQASL